MINIIQNQDQKKRITTFLNPFSYILLRKNKKQLKFFNIKIDGFLLVILLNIFGLKVKRESFDMTSLAPIIFKDAIKNNQSIYFIGTKVELIDKAINNIKIQYPNLNICGYRDGYFEENERTSILRMITSLNPDYVICGMGAIKQENFLLDLTKYKWQGIGYTCGGFLHQTANDIQYYPHWINRLGLRAFYRMYDEPKLVKRYFIDYPLAICIIIYDLIKQKFYAKNNII